MKSPSTAITATFGLEPAPYRALLDCLAESARVFVYSGSGLSADSGLPTYRGAGEHLWTNDLVQRVATLDGYLSNPVFAARWYIQQTYRLQHARPHEGHEALHEMEQYWNVVHATQNVDRLLEQAGCSSVAHLHGCCDRQRCTQCDWSGDMTPAESLLLPCPVCEGVRQPAVVLLGEDLDRELLARVEGDIAVSDLVLVIGTPAEMYPGAALLEQAHDRRIPICVINPEWCENLHYARWQLFGGAKEVLPTFIREAVQRKRRQGAEAPWYLRWIERLV